MTPARAGTTDHPLDQRRSPTDDPRSRGDDYGAASSSPMSRRMTPARAGTT